MIESLPGFLSHFTWHAVDSGRAPSAFSPSMHLHSELCAQHSVVGRRRVWSEAVFCPAPDWPLGVRINPTGTPHQSEDLASSLPVGLCTLRFPLPNLQAPEASPTLSGFLPLMGTWRGCSSHHLEVGWPCDMFWLMKCERKWCQRASHHLPFSMPWSSAVLMAPPSSQFPEWWQREADTPAPKDV